MPISAAAQKRYPPEWPQIRLQILERDNFLCHCPRCLGGELRVRPAHEVDHITPLARGGKDDLSNMQLLCFSCHANKTREEQRARNQKLKG